MALQGDPLMLYIVCMYIPPLRPSSAYPQKWNVVWKSSMFVLLLLLFLFVKYRRVKESLKKREFERARCMYTDKE